MRWYQWSPEVDIWPWGYFPKFSHVHQIIKFQVCLQILSLIACCSPADTLALEQSKWNELRQTSSLENQQLCKAKKSKEKLSWRQSAPYCRKKHRQMMMIELRGEIPAISAAFCGNSVYIDFDITPRLRPRLWDQTTEREWYDFTHTFSFSRSKLDSLFLGVLIYFGAGLSHLPLGVERHLIKNFHFPPKMETSPSSPRINQTRGEEKWKCENRKSREIRNAKEESFQMQKWEF